VFNTDNLSNSPQETFNLGLEVAKHLAPNSCILISGTLGAGKTQLIKGICSYFSISDHEVQSPTYSLHHSYLGSKEVHHFDLYRLNNSQEFIDRGFLDIINTDTPMCIEWPEKVSLNLFKNKKCITIEIKPLNETQRIIKITNG